MAAKEMEEPTVSWTLVVGPAERAMSRWRCPRVSLERNPLPGSPIFDVLIKELH
ncbi:hypothetical protein [Saccharopolyspora shandongensis]|uniref:hypothetical protein n=1 Tax=Saccharopolyspora shandongensis TaxID=418495 RepID=UPI0033E6F039